VPQTPRPKLLDHLFSAIPQRTPRLSVIPILSTFDFASFDPQDAPARNRLTLRLCLPGESSR